MTITIPSIPAKALGLYVVSGLVAAAFTFGFAFALLPGPTAATPALDAAVNDGWGVHFARGYVSALTFRQLLYGGAGAVIIVHYGSLPVGDRNQPSFTGDHAMYVDAFVPSDGADGARYYVLDPIGKP